MAFVSLMYASAGFSSGAAPSVARCEKPPGVDWSSPVVFERFERSETRVCVRLEPPRIEPSPRPGRLETDVKRQTKTRANVTPAWRMNAPIQ